MAKSRQTRNLLLSTLLLAIAPFAQASDVRRGDTVLVSATVRSHFRFDFQQPDTLSITKEDIERGFIDVPAPAEVAYQTNHPSGLVLLVDALGPMFASARINGAGLNVEVGAAGGFKTLSPAAGNREIAGSVHVRLELSADAVVGTHAWPVKLSARMPGKTPFRRS